MRRILFLVFVSLVFEVSAIKIVEKQPVFPVLVNSPDNPVLCLTITGCSNERFCLNFSFSGNLPVSDVQSLRLYGSNVKGKIDLHDLLAGTTKIDKDISIWIPSPKRDTTIIWCTLTLCPEASIDRFVKLSCTNTQCKKNTVLQDLRLGLAIRQTGQDGIHTSRIPCLATTRKGTLVAAFDARHENSHDLQGDIDIAVRRSYDGGQTWRPLQTVLDMKTWGNLPERYNGVSDACILVDPNNDKIFIAALWMHGILDEKTGQWVKGLTKDSTRWSHQWRGRGSQPGLDVYHSSQLLITNSQDDGATWAPPRNLTKQVKNPKWWLFSVAPGHGIALDDGTLVFPSQGRDSMGQSFSNIIWSKDHGENWTVSAAAFTNTTECMAVQLGDGSLMLNMRDNRNRGHRNPNGRRICISSDMGQTWTEHPTSFKALVEPTCMGCLHRHDYTQNGTACHVLLFSNPHSYNRRNNLTLQYSLDDGLSWQPHKILLDEGTSMAYSCITSISPDTIGILYESSRAQLVFQRITLKEILSE